MIIWENYKNKLDMVYMSMPESVSGLDAYFRNLSLAYYENFSPELDARGLATI